MHIGPVNNSAPLEQQFKSSSVFKEIQDKLKQVGMNFIVINISTHFFDRSVLVVMIIDPFLKHQILVHNDEFPKSEALYRSLNMVTSTEISENPSYKVQSSKSQSLKFYSCSSILLPFSVTVSQ